MNHLIVCAQCVRMLWVWRNETNGTKYDGFSFEQDNKNPSATMKVRHMKYSSFCCLNYFNLKFS